MVEQVSTKAISSNRIKVSIKDSIKEIKVSIKETRGLFRETKVLGEE
jgi:hypothetical protein